MNQKKLIRLKKKEADIEGGCCGAGASPKKEKFYYDSIVIHINGGGFVAMSSFSHQSYTRKWVK